MISQEWSSRVIPTALRGICADEDAVAVFKAVGTQLHVEIALLDGDISLSSHSRS